MLSRFVFDPAELPTAVWQLFFHDCELFFDNIQYFPTNVQLFSGGAIKKVIIKNNTYLEQDPHSTNEWGRLARTGKKILWIIDPSGLTVGRVVNGKVTQIR